MSPGASFNLPLPPDTQEWIDRLIQQGAFASAGDYIAQLIREDQDRRRHAEIEKKLLEALESGPATPMTPEDWDEMRHELRRRAADRRDGRLSA